MPWVGVPSRWQFKLRPLTFRLFKPSAFAQTGGGALRLFVSEDATAVVVGAAEVGEQPQGPLGARP